jgi:hypothetical protein
MEMWDRGRTINRRRFKRNKGEDVLKGTRMITVGSRNHVEVIG